MNLNCRKPISLFVLWCIGGLASAAVLPPPPGATVINFDALPEPCIFSSATALTTRFSTSGVTFMGPGGSDGGAILNECGGFGVTGHSPPNFLAFNVGATLLTGGTPRGPETILFTPAVSGVQINVGKGSSSGIIMLECFNSSSASVGVATTPITAALSTLLVSASGIARCVLSSAAPVWVADDLAFVTGPTPPDCTIMAPAGVVSEDIAIDVDANSLNSSSVTITLEHSTDGGMTFQASTMSALSANPNPAVGVPLGITSFIWDSRGDGVGIAAVAVGVVLRATILDGVAAPGECTTTVDVDNTVLCFGICGDCDLNAAGPNILDALAAAQIAAGIIVPSGPVQIACCDVNTSTLVDVIDALLIAQEAAGLTVTLACV